MARVLVESKEGLKQEIEVGRHRLLADEPATAGGADAGADPYGLLLAALGTCTSMTLRMYARRKNWPLDSVRVELRHWRVHPDDVVASCEGQPPRLDRIERRITLRGRLDAAQVERLGEIAAKCPVHKTLTAGIEVVDVIES